MDYHYNASSSSSTLDVNPYHQPYAGPQFPATTHHHAPVPANAYEYDVGILAQQSVYVPGAMIDKRGGSGGKIIKGGKRTTVLRKGAGKVWEDQTLLEWNPCESDRVTARLCAITQQCPPAAWFRLFVGDLSNDVSDDVLSTAFNKYTSFQKARVIRDRLSQKVCCVCMDAGTLMTSVDRPSMASSHSQTRKTFLRHGRRWTVRCPGGVGYGADFVLGKYVGNRPVRLKKADNNIRPVEIGHKKAKQLEKDLKKDRHKPY